MKIYLSSWLYNAGIVGIYNILTHAGHKVTKELNYLEFDDKCLKNFSEKYFNYLIEVHNDELSCTKVIASISNINLSDIDNIDDKIVTEINNTIKYVKGRMQSNSYLSAFRILGVDEEANELINKLTNLKFSKKTSDCEKISSVRQVMKDLNEIKSFLLNEKINKYVKCKNVIFDVITNFWDGVSALHRKKQDIDMFENFNDYFIKPIVMTESITGKEKIWCSNCDTPMKTAKEGFSLAWLNNIGVDAKRKTSHYWNLNNDGLVCPVCNLVYSCIPAGFNYKIRFERGIFVNKNVSVSQLIAANYKEKDALKLNDSEIKVLGSFANKCSDKQNGQDNYNEYNETKQVDNIQVIKFVTYRNEDKTKVLKSQYEFVILSRERLMIFTKYWNTLENIASTFILVKDSNNSNKYINIYSEVVDKIYQGQNLYGLINYLLKYSVYVNSYICTQLLKINLSIIKVEEKELVDNYSKINEFAGHGQMVRNVYVFKGWEKKINSIVYKLLNALKTKNASEFMYIMMNMYTSLDKPLPLGISTFLVNDVNFLTYGYAFLVGLKGEKSKKEKEDITV